MVKKNIEIHSENILPIIKKWLYSDKEIFVRELISNACDAIHKLKVLGEQGKVLTGEDQYRILVKVDKENRTLKFIDNGIGMTAEEIEKYIAQIAFSGAEEFAKKYQSNNQQDQFIGHFGLGFYSAYMVAQKVEIHTRSYLEDAEPAIWSCDGSSEYELLKGSRQERGTEITLFLDEDNVEFLEESKIKQILTHYCSFLPYPIYLGDTHINHHVPLWIKSPSECTKQDYLEFYRHLYPMDQDPLFWIHLNVDYPFNLKGILYFPKIKKNFELNKKSINLYCNRVFVSNDCQDIIPSYLMPLKGIIESPDIPLNVSRSYLQMDKMVRQLGKHISKKVCDSLTTLYRNEKERYLNSWEDLSLVVKLGILEDENFYDRVKEILIWRSVENNWMTLEDYLEKNKNKTKDNIYYISDKKSLVQFLDIYKNKEIDVLCINDAIDSYVMSHLETKLSSVKFKRIDSDLDEHILDKEKEKTVLDASGKTEAGKLADFIRSKLADQNIEVEAKSLASNSISGFVMIEENQRRLRDYMLAMNAQDGTQLFEGKRTFVVNTNHTLLTSIQKIDQRDPQLAKELVQQTYELALLSQKEMNLELLAEFVCRNQSILEKLTELACK